MNKNWKKCECMLKFLRQKNRLHSLRNRSKRENNWKNLRRRLNFQIAFFSLRWCTIFSLYFSLIKIVRSIRYSFFFENFEYSALLNLVYFRLMNIHFFIYSYLRCWRREEFGINSSGKLSNAPLLRKSEKVMKINILVMIWWKWFSLDDRLFLWLIL